MSISNAHKKLRIAADELEKARLMKSGFGNLEKYQTEYVQAEKKYLDARLLCLDADIQEYESIKLDLIAQFKNKYPHYKEVTENV